MVDIDRLRKLSIQARAEVSRGVRYGDSRAAFLSQFDDEVLHELVEIAWRNRG